jgi:hypothetical protein
MKTKLESKKLELSDNKQNYKTIHGSYSLTYEEIYQVTQHYRKKGINIFVQTYLDTNISDPMYSIRKMADIANQALHIMRQLQANLTGDQCIGYIHTSRGTGDDSGHVESFIITKSLIIKPVTWLDTIWTADIDGSEGDRASTTLYKIPLIPQADEIGCASIGLAYLKQLLKNDFFCGVFLIVNESHRLKHAPYCFFNGTYNIA